MRTTAAVALLLAGCAAPPAPPQAGPKPAARPEGSVLTGAPDGAGAIASVDPAGRWQAGGTAVEHWIYEPETRRRAMPMDVGRSLTLFRGSLPFPHFSWQPSDLQVNQLVYPVGQGFAAMYHVMNHGENPKACRLFVGVAGDVAQADGRTLKAGRTPLLSTSDATSASRDGDGGRPALAFDLTIEPGSSKFVFVTTPDLDGRVPEGALEAAAEAWERKLGPRRLVLPDKALMTAYYADLAGAALGVAGCAESARKVEAKLVRKEGDALRLLPELPEAWATEAVEASGIATPWGAVSFKYEGAFNTPAIELGAGCAPPGGFLVKLPEKLRAAVDGKPVEVRDGFVRMPAGARKLETLRPSE
jgi:hypothetical protein